MRHGLSMRHMPAMSIISTKAPVWAEEAEPCRWDPVPQAGGRRAPGPFVLVSGPVRSPAISGLRSEGGSAPTAYTTEPDPRWPESATPMASIRAAKRPRRAMRPAERGSCRFRLGVDGPIREDPGRVREQVRASRPLRRLAAPPRRATVPALTRTRSPPCSRAWDRSTPRPPSACAPTRTRSPTSAPGGAGGTRWPGPGPSCQARQSRRVPLPVLRHGGPCTGARNRWARLRRPGEYRTEPGRHGDSACCRLGARSTR
ncbi:hypothetical protein HNR06_002311 [Nocardiopsis arvandica]|uniref:Uncharacterized protein n=1 Tax=Nocardiopsis sinuspersici TaxID=501010 RepID=A0A7Y9XD75_9ACTN|nr:hypothetical protein [Nocardiopsis sinuspersici]